MRIALPILVLLLASACGKPDHAPVTGEVSGQGANGAMWGTDAHLAPSRPDAILRYAGHPRGFAELRLPAGSGPFPLAVIFHGGCFKTGVADQAYMSPLATRWQERGVASLNVDYREVGDGGGWPGSFQDWAAAADLIDEVAARYPVDRDRITLVGHSAGALPALWLASPGRAEGPIGARAATPAASAIVLDGPGNLGRERASFDALCQFAAVDPFMKGHSGAAIAPAPRLRNVLFVQAAHPAPPAESLTEIEAAGAEVAVRINPDESHFSIISPGESGYAANEPAMLRILKAR